VIFLDEWMKILSDLTAPYISSHLEDRIYKQILIEGQQFSKEKETEFKDGIELFGKLMMAHLDHKQKKGMFEDMFGDYMVESETCNKIGRAHV
jgi:hypothetical protein